MPTLFVVVVVSLLLRCATAQFSLSLAMHSLYFCKASYCDASQLTSWSCGPSCQFNPTMTDVTVAINSSIESQGLVGYDAALGMIIVAFRGSYNILNWFNDLNFIPISYPYCNNCAVHEGFYGEWNSMYPIVMPAAKLLKQKYGAPFLVVGHSLGAAVSTLAAMDLVRSVSKDVTVYNFGSPRVGNPTFAAWAITQLPQRMQFRVTHAADPVPHVPPLVFGFLHAMHELWFNNDSNNTYVSCNDSPTAEDPNCADSTFPIDIFDHLLYLGVCTECTCDGVSKLRQRADTRPIDRSKLRHTRGHL